MSWAWLGLAAALGWVDEVDVIFIGRAQRRLYCKAQGEGEQRYLQWVDVWLGLAGGQGRTRLDGMRLGGTEWGELGLCGTGWCGFGWGEMEGGGWRGVG